jgi:PIN domain nuclease of toxin-antitoxin system
MRLLLDTHARLWFVLGDASLTSAARSAIEDPQNEKLISAASYWELAIKSSMGKFRLPRPYADFIDHAIRGQGFSVMPVATTHATVVSELPFHHRDPFDRLLVAQALAENIPLVSADEMLDRYGVRRLW